MLAFAQFSPRLRLTLFTPAQRIICRNRQHACGGLLNRRDQILGAGDSGPGFEGRPLSRFRIRVVVAAAAAISGCSYAGPVVETTPIARHDSELEALKRQYLRALEVPFPTDNPYSEEKRLLGQTLYFDPRLSKTGTLSCASCHNPALGWQDGLSLGRGHKGNRLRRHSPTILNLAWASSFFWDGRAESLEAQAVGPMLADAEMGMSEEAIVARIKAAPGYAPMFTAAFPEKDISLATVAAAIATFERTIVSERAPFDRWIEGDENAINDGAKRGFVTFNKKANCAACHSGWRFTDDGFHDIGLGDKDLGRGEVVADVAELQHAFKTPTLRNIAQRAPYMHDGSLDTLAAVIRHYERDFIKRKSLSVEMRTYELSEQERADMLAFLLTLTSKDPPVTVPVLPK
jgi:cytochrome c peroxidase